MRTARIATVLSLLLLVAFFILFADPVSQRDSDAVGGSSDPPRRLSRAERERQYLLQREEELALEKASKRDPDEEIPYFYLDDPLTRQQLGRRSWGYLHTMVSNWILEEGETEDDKLKMIGDFLKLWGRLYPCRVCGGHFEEMLARTPPPSEGTKADIELWLCERHNEVNVRLKKPQFECTVENIRAHYFQTDGCPME